MTADFRPLPFLRSPHQQTILAMLLNYWQPGLSARCRPIVLPDGDRVLLYDSVPLNWRPGAPVALLVHGLTGSHRSGSLTRLGRILVRQAIRVVRLDLRGAGRGLRFARKTYNAGCSDDVRAAAEEVLHWTPASPLLLAGFSLGGNVVLKLAGEAATRPLPNLAGVAAVNPPVDLTICSDLLAKPENLFYNNYYSRALVRLVQQHRLHFPELPLIDFPKEVTLRQFDDLYTAPRGGFADSGDYYSRASALPLLDAIEVPTLIILARDDPFVAVEPIAALPPRAHREIRLPAQGGHLGYVGWNGDLSLHWAEPQVAGWMLRTIRSKPGQAAIRFPLYPEEKMPTSAFR